MRFWAFLLICFIGFACRADNPFAVFFYAGLGNRMFFLAGQVAYARHFNKDICLMAPFDSAFRIPYRICTSDEVKRAEQNVCVFPRFSPEFYTRDDCLTIEGCYLQDERFFAEDREFIQDLFQFAEPLPDKLKPLEQQIRETESVSIHIRRTDYRFQSNRYPIMSLDYYEAGADYIQQRTDKPIHLFVFSDEPRWVQKHFKSKYPFTLVSDNSAVEDMHLMSLCHHNIIANSTFSWWGAWLNKNPGKIVVAPDEWDKIDTWWGDDIIPQDWIVLPAHPQKGSATP